MPLKQEPATTYITVKRLNKIGLLNQPMSVWAVFFASVIAFMGISLVNPILPKIAEQLNASPSEVTLLFTSYNAIMAFAMLITGVISSRISHKWTLIIGVGIIALVSVLGGFAENIWALVAIRGGWGLGNALFIATALAAIVSLSKSGTARAIILYEAAVGLGISVGPLLGGTIGSISWRWPFFAVSFLMLIAFIILITCIPKSNNTRITHTSFKRTFATNPLIAMRHRPIFVLGLVSAFYNVGFFTIMAYAPFVLNLETKDLGYVFLGWGIMLALTSVFMAPKLQQCYGTIKSICIMLILFLLDLIVIGIFTSIQWIVIIAVIFAGFTLGNNNTLITTAVMDVATVERSAASAAYSFLRFLGAAIAPYMAGKLGEIYNPHVPFFVGAGFVLLSFICIRINYQYIKHIDFV